MVVIIKTLDISGKQLQEKGSQLREQDRHEEALQYLSLAIVAYQKEGNYEGLIDTLKDKTLTWKHYYLLSKDLVYAILAQKDAEAMLAIAEKYKLKGKLGTSYFRLGEINMLFEDYSSAIKNYNKSIKFFLGCDAEKGDYRYHLGEALYQDGQKKKGKGIMLKGLREIRDNAEGVDPFLIHVWESGCYMRLAELLRNDEPKGAKKHYGEAKKIADNDPKLVIRRRQIAKLGKLFD